MKTLRNLMSGTLMLLALITVPVAALAAFDTTPPTTTATLTGTMGSDGWYTTSVTVTLAAADGPDGSGVAKTEYSPDNVTWQTYSIPLVLSTDGKQYVYFRSTDNAGNLESPAKSQEIKINRTGLVGLWHMDGDWKDASVMGNSGTPYNGATFSTNAKIGTWSGSFDGVNDYVRIPDSDNLSPQVNGQMSLSAWVYIRAYPSGGQNRLPVIAKGTTGNYEYALYVYNTGAVGLSLWQLQGAGHIEIAGGTLPLNTWTHVAGVYNLSATKKAVVYVNGAEVASGSTTSGSVANGSSPVDIGHRPDNYSYQYLNALLDEVSIYNRALQETEIQEQYRTYIVITPTLNPVTSPTTSAIITLSGTKSANTAIAVNGNTLVPLDATTSWKTSYTLSQGINTISVTARDSQNRNSLPVTQTVLLDTTPPAVGATPAGGIYNSTQSVALAANEPAVIYYTTDGSTPTVSAATYSQPISIPAGATLKYFGRDLAGNNSEIITENYVIDATSPVLTISTLSDGAYTNNEILNIAGTVTDNTGVQGITVNDTAVPVNADGSFSYALLLKNGGNNITIAAADSAGNTAADTRTVTLDQTAPVLAVATPADNSKTGNMLLEVSGTVDETSTVTVKMKDIVQSAVMNGGAFAATINLEPGYNTIEITAADLAGNQSTVKRTVVFDDQVPSLAVTAPNQDIRTNQSRLTIKGTVSDALTAVGVTISTDNGIFAPPVIDGTFEQAVNFAEEKAYGVVVTATNEVGTSASVQRNVIYDITPPALSIDPVATPTSQPSQSVSGTREAGAAVTVTCATATVGEVSYPTATTWQVDISGLREGENVINASSADTAGNAVTATATVVLATRPPQITITATPDVIWPASHQMVPVTIAGRVKANGSVIKSVSISVSDEYGKYEYDNLTFGSTIMLEAWRNGNDTDGRKYTITVVATDRDGVTTAKTATVTVPHDMSNRKKMISRKSLR